MTKRPNDVVRATILKRSMELILERASKVPLDSYVNPVSLIQVGMTAGQVLRGLHHFPASSKELTQFTQLYLLIFGRVGRNDPKEKLLPFLIEHWVEFTRGNLCDGVDGSGDKTPFADLWVHGMN